MIDIKKLLLCLIFLLSFSVVEASGCDALLTREAAEFIQSACRDTLTGYGNYVKITSSSGTYVLYAHLSKFIDGVDMPLNKTCPKKADGSAPCPDVRGCTTQNVIKL